MISLKLSSCATSSRASYNVNVTATFLHSFSSFTLLAWDQYRASLVPNSALQMYMTVKLAIHHLLLLQSLDNTSHNKTKTCWQTLHSCFLDMYDRLHTPHLLLISPPSGYISQFFVMMPNILIKYTTCHFPCKSLLYASSPKKRNHDLFSVVTIYT